MCDTGCSVYLTTIIFAVLLSSLIYNKYVFIDNENLIVNSSLPKDINMTATEFDRGCFTVSNQDKIACCRWKQWKGTDDLSCQFLPQHSLSHLYRGEWERESGLSDSVSLHTPTMTEAVITVPTVYIICSTFCTVENKIFKCVIKYEQL